MLTVALILCCFGTALSENIQCWTLEQITDLIYQDNDLNQDGSLDMGELYAMLTGWGIVAGGQGAPLSEFANQWVAKYHDTHAVAHAFAVNLDVDGDHFISSQDLIVLLTRYDTNANGQAEKAEFLTFLNAEHPTKGNGNHGCH